MISIRKIKARTKHKTNSSTSQAILLALKSKSKGWFPAAQRLSAGTRQHLAINLDRIDELTKAGDTVIVLGKVLGVGEITKKVRICALGFSCSARDKLKKTKSEAVSLLEEIQKNPRAEGIKIIQ